MVPLSSTPPPGAPGLIRCRAFQLPRRGNPREECDDAFAMRPDLGRFAVADGAAESAHAGEWARLLVEEFVAGAPGADWPDWIAPLQRRWQERTGVVAESALPWYLEERYRQGAFSTFLGVALDAERWYATAVGDSCLFHVRGGRLEAAFPLHHSSQFDNTPWLVGARTPAEGVPREHGQRLSGTAWPGDCLFLATDALARWFLAEAEAGRRPWAELDGLLDGPADDDEALARWVGLQRDARLLRNDDTTLIAVRL